MCVSKNKIYLLKVIAMFESLFIHYIKCIYIHIFPWDNLRFRAIFSKIGQYRNTSVISGTYFFASVTKIYSCCKWMLINSDTWWWLQKIECSTGNNRFITVTADVRSFWRESIRRRLVYHLPRPLYYFLLFTCKSRFSTLSMKW